MQVGKYETPVTRLHKFVSGVSDSDVYVKIADVFKKFGAQFEDDSTESEEVFTKPRNEIPNEADEDTIVEGAEEAL